MYFVFNCDIWQQLDVEEALQLPGHRSEEGVFLSTVAVFMWRRKVDVVT